MQALGKGCGEETADQWRDTAEVCRSTMSLPQMLYRDIQPKNPEKQVVRSKFPVTPQRVKVSSSELMSRAKSDSNDMKLFAMQANRILSVLYQD